MQREEQGYLTPKEHRSACSTYCLPLESEPAGRSDLQVAGEDATLFLVKLHLPVIIGWALKESFTDLSHSVRTLHTCTHNMCARTHTLIFDDRC